MADLKGIPLKPQKPVWWKVIVGSLLLFTSINNLLNPAPNLLKAGTSDEQLGMHAGTVMIAALGVWLIVSGVRPVWRKIAP